MKKYVIASSREWFDQTEKSEDFKKLNIQTISTKAELTKAHLDAIKPRFVFFPHWNWKVSAEIHDNYECVVFHSAPLPYGRGGSPIQNLIIRGHKTTPVCALRMTEELDAGPIYGALEVSLDGNVDEIFRRIGQRVESLIVSICANEPVPVPQTGTPVCFNRLSQSDNLLSDEFSLEDLFDRIRMVDGAGYPKAHIKFGKYRIEFSSALLEDDALTAKIKIQDDHD